MKRHTDQQLAALSLAGQNSAFEELVRRHQDVVRHWLRRLAGDHARADDVAQETFVRAWQQLSAYRGDGEFRSWLLTIAYRQFLQSLRRQKSRASLLEQVEQQDLQEATGSGHDALPDLARLLSVLTVEERACMLLCYSQGHSHGEVSALLDMPLGTVKSHIRRSVQRIREHFGIEVS